MAIDPVCNMEVDESTSIKSEYNGKEYFFCSEDCKKEFDRNPQQFVKAA